MVAMAPCLPTRPTLAIPGGGATLSGLCRRCRKKSRLTDKKPPRTNRSARLFGAFEGLESPVDGGRQTMRLPVWFQNAGSSGRQSVLWVTGQSLLSAAGMLPHPNLRGAPRGTAKERGPGDGETGQCRWISWRRMAALCRGAATLDSKIKAYGIEV